MATSLLVGGSNEVYIRTTSLPSITAFTMAIWWRSPGDPGTISNYPVLYRNNGATDTQWIGVYVLWSGSVLTLSMDSTVNGHTGGSTMANQTWYHLALTRSGNTYTSYLNGVQNSQFTDATVITNTRMYVAGNDFTGGGGGSFEYAAIKVWDGVVLTAAQLVQEMRQYLPVFTSGIHIFSPLFSAVDDQVDYSGNGFTWTVQGVPVTVDGPPIPWCQGRHRVQRPTAAVVAGTALNLRLDEPIIGASSF